MYTPAGKRIVDRTDDRPTLMGVFNFDLFHDAAICIIQGGLWLMMIANDRVQR